MFSRFVATLSKSWLGEFFLAMQSTLDFHVCIRASVVLPETVLNLLQRKDHILRIK